MVPAGTLSGVVLRNRDRRFRMAFGDRPLGRIERVHRWSPCQAPPTDETSVGCCLFRRIRTAVARQAFAVVMGEFPASSVSHVQHAVSCQHVSVTSVNGSTPRQVFCAVSMTLTHYGRHRHVDCNKARTGRDGRSSVDCRGHLCRRRRRPRIDR
jgi:hypothetical protein